MDIADFNNDGFPDFVLPIGHYLGLSFIWSNGDEPFTGSLSMYSNMNNRAMPTENDLLTLDFDNDNRTDVAIVNGNPAFRGNNIALFRNENDNFTITNSKVYAIGDRPTKGLADDLNNDGLTDIVVQYNWKKIKILLNNSEMLPTSVSHESVVKYYSTDCTLIQNYPNPFNNSTTIRYKLSKPVFVTISIYNLFGKEVETLVNDFRTTGEYELEWKPKSFSSGIYFCRLQAGLCTATKKLFLKK
jgi:hypothetical protein